MYHFPKCSNKWKAIIMSESVFNLRLLCICFCVYISCFKKKCIYLFKIYISCFLCCFQCVTEFRRFIITMWGGSCTDYNKASGTPLPSSKTFTTCFTYEGLIIGSDTTTHTSCSACCPPGRGTGVSASATPDSPTSSSTRLSCRIVPPLSHPRMPNYDQVTEELPYVFTWSWHDQRLYADSQYNSTRSTISHILFQVV